MAIRVIEGDASKIRAEGPLVFKEMPLAHHYCVGHGIELGAAAHNPFGLNDCINVAPWSDTPGHVDYKDFAFYCAEQTLMCGKYVGVDVVGEAHAIPLPDASQDYVLSSHVIEHLPNLIAAFKEWNRVLKPGGIVFMIFPKRDALPSDRKRPITPLEHFIEDYRRNIDITTDDSDPPVGVRGHYHVFTLQSMLELIEWCNQNLNLLWRVEAVEETDSKVGNGHTVVCRYIPEQASALYHAQQAHPARTYQYSFQRFTELVKSSAAILKNEGVGAFWDRLRRWLHGERRYYR